MDANITAAIGGIITMAASDAIFPHIPITATANVITLGEAPIIVSFMKVPIKPTCSAIPIPSVMVRTRPSGAKPVKFLIMLSSINTMPSLDKRFLAITGLLVTGSVT
ncbi:hypothetical protein SDC9_107327 [bioreactor metagenome]|uniref:Uncharacterized protein n=1 Tax=bioreactor metagenome TaxID=1076179 RepID=A0A645B601_9ZZZZ